MQFVPQKLQLTGVGGSGWIIVGSYENVHYACCVADLKLEYRPNKMKSGIFRKEQNKELYINKVPCFVEVFYPKKY